MEGLRGKILSFLSPLGSMTFQRYSTVQTIIDEYRDNRDFIGDIWTIISLKRYIARDIVELLF